ncbi:formate dehydrogenase major subunit [Aquimarina sp. EL_43]|uniref:formate dehydrogenase subunit alpha n=1 Tax=unclassified Aquimarina TaxID=2627091 RepID=UPI0018C92A5B|nr:MULTISPECIES: formate dehydrogenase subunit alpha [unclassified Aquimarina]MBG6129828.1 formate dehydrogenase major subunit [Aquimarina sp. EL_35]MBG6150893.1 formate dehydrogenase major subunit [Aquimarina sp. EL_32]MBG6167800.1 formate dehydrogenase major subunit [Aquimarina sp. EL_43]
MKTAYIDNQAFEIVEGETMLTFIRRYKERNLVPTLCDAPNLDPFGSCRVCSVEVALEENGAVKTMASCHTPVVEGQYIYTNSESVKELRKNIVELVLTDHPLDCLTCEVNGNCELQTVAAQVGIREVRYPEGDNHLYKTKDLSHPYMTSDLSKCINCYRCVRACDEVQGQFVLSMSGRGFDSSIIKGLDQSFMDSDCVSCGACSQACPTSAISDVFQSKAIKATDTTRTICTYCGVGCNLEVATSNGEILSIQAPYDAEVNQGHTCLKGRYAFKFYDHPERLNSPMIKRNGTFEKVSWDEVYDYIASKLTAYKNEFGSDSMAGISSSRCTNEENYLMQKFFRAVIQTNNIDGCARVCHSPTALGMQRTFGTGAATNSIDDLKDTNCIMVIGANPTDAHPVTGAKLKQFAMKSDNVSIVIDPRRTELAKYATHHLALRPGTNVAVLNMMMYYIITEGLADTSFIESRTEGFEDYKKEILAINIDKLEAVSGVDRNQVREAAIAYASAPNAMSFHGLGVTEHSQGTFTVMQIADLALLTGNIGRRGVGVNPLRGQNNVQGSADMGVQPHQGAGYLDVTNDQVNKTYNEFYGVNVPKNIGYKIPEMFDAALKGNLKAIWIIGEDVVQTDPNTQKVIRALQATDLVIVQELFMTETAKYADVILPGASFLEKSGTFTNGERRVQAVHKVVDPIEGSKPDGQIIVDIMNKMGYAQPDYTPDGMLEEISQIVPFFAGIKWDRLGENGLQWPVAKDGTDTQILHKTDFKRGKGYFEFNPWEETKELTSHAKDYPYILTTNRELEHYNCGAMTRRTSNEQILSDDYLMIHPEDAQENLVNEGDYVCLESPRGKVDVKARITDEVKKGVLSTTFHFPEIMINNLTGDIHDSEAMCPEYKVVAVRIRKSKGKFKPQLS